MRKVGEKVRISVNLENNKSTCFEMQYYKGKIATITKRHPETVGVYDIDLDGGIFAWEENMFEEVNKRELPIIKSVRTNETINIKERRTTTRSIAKKMLEEEKINPTHEMYFYRENQDLTLLDTDKKFIYINIEYTIEDDKPDIIEDINTKRSKLIELSKPLVEFLNDNYHPHVKIIITPTDCELVEGLMSGKIEEFLKD